MKTQVIQLDPLDDIISARDKLGWSKANRVLLVWPENETILERRLDLVLLQRHAQALGVQLVLVTGLVEVREFADELNIPYYKDLRKAQNAHWRLPRRFRRRKLNPKGALRLRQKRTGLTPPPRRSRTLPLAARLLFFAVGVLAVFSLAAGVLPGAQIQLAPRHELQEITFSIQPDAELKTFNLSGAVPARPISVIVEGRDSQPTSGLAQFPDQPARGQVTFTNLTDAPVMIPASTVVRSSGTPEIRFSVTNSGSVPISSTLSLPVQALTPGPGGNLPARRLVAIEGLLGTQLAVTNPQATRGGTQRQSPVPVEKDRQVLQQRLSETLYASALAELEKTLGSQDVLLRSTVQLSRILEQQFEPDSATPADALSLRLRLEFSAFVVQGADLRMLAEAVLDANLPDGYSPLAGTLEIRNQLPADSSASESEWQLSARRQLRALISESEAARLVLGQPRETALQTLEARLPLAQAPAISLSPQWWPRLPILPLRITVSQLEPSKP